MSALLFEDLALHGAEPQPADPAADGFHYRHCAPAEQMTAIASVFRDQGFFLELLTAEDRRADLERMRLVYLFNHFERAERHVVFADIEPGTRGGSIVSVYRGADWYEREVWDMYGIDFVGHPDMRRLLLAEDVDFHPLLKDFGRIEDAPAADGEG